MNERASATFAIKGGNLELWHSHNIRLTGPRVETCHWNFGPAINSPGQLFPQEILAPWAILTGRIGPSVEILVL